MHAPAPRSRNVLRTTRQSSAGSRDRKLEHFRPRGIVCLTIQVGQIVRGSKLVSEELQRKGAAALADRLSARNPGADLRARHRHHRAERLRDRTRRKERDADVARKAQAMTSAIERRAYTSSAYLRAGAALLSTQDEVAELFRRSFPNCGSTRTIAGPKGLAGHPLSLRRRGRFRNAAGHEPGGGKASHHN